MTAGRSNKSGKQPDAEPLVRVEDLKVYFPVTQGLVFERRTGDVRAVDDVSFDIQRGETLGLVGESGCGKTTVGRTILRLYDPTEGAIYFEGNNIAHLSGGDLRRLRRRMQMVFQDPYSSLNPRQNVGNIVSEPLLVHGISANGSMDEKVQELLDVVGLPKNAHNRYPHEFSGGQRQRIGLARALALNPDLIVADEPVSALDVSIQAQIINLLEDLQDRFDLTYLFIAHDLAVVRHISDRIAVMYLGKIMEVAPAEELYINPLHPYTMALLSAVPIPDPEVEVKRERILLSGDLPSPQNPPSGCRFHTRCPFAQPERCPDEVPALRVLKNGHSAACHYAEEIQAGKIKARPPEEAGIGEDAQALAKSTL
ncbi:MAG: ABC transporter ATP-binding protein [Actinomycetota bacterium]